MNDELWKNILDFNLDKPLSEYGFTTRLENENFWTVGFARDAITEYKKFMYLAAVSDSMVSPSAIVDIVWHQHLIFTQSYENFSLVLGKKIAHIPSTHQSSEYAQFQSAKERTSRLYNENFGTQPPEFWEYDNMYGPLSLESSRYTITDVITVGLLLLLVLFAIAYFALRPLYVTIENPDFLLGYCSIVVITMAVLHFYNRAKLLQMVNGWERRSFIFNLSALELVYLSKNQLNAVINGVVNRLILDKKIVIQSGQLLKVNQPVEANNTLELCVLQTISAWPASSYQTHLGRLANKPAFNKTARAMDALRNYIDQSVPFIQLFMLNFAALSVLFVLGAVRLATGISRDRPIELILIVMVLCSIGIGAYLWYLSKAMGITALPLYYKNNILPEKTESKEWDWEYFMLGTAVFDFAFVSMANPPNNSGGFGGDSGSSCGSGGDSGGSSCGGSSCGGCGSS